MLIVKSKQFIKLVQFIWYFNLGYHKIGCAKLQKSSKQN